MKIQKAYKKGAVQYFKYGSWPFGKPVMYVHNFFVDGLLIDTGHSNMQKEVVQTLSSLEVQQMYLTHHHEDHTGNSLVLQKQFNCPVYASSKCVKIMKNPPSISFAQWLTWGISKKNLEITTEDQFIQTPNYTFEIIPLPGHAVDMVGLYERNQGWLFSADLFVHTYIRVFMRPESMKGQIASIKKALSLDFQWLFCSHNPQFEQPKDKLRQKLAFFENFYGQVVHFHQKGYSINGIIQQMELKEKWFLRLLSTGELSTKNMISAVLRDEGAYVFE